jgi:hypothetical protein
MGYFITDEFRTNKLSLTPGGSKVIVNYLNGETKAYDKVKSPKAYVNAILKLNSGDVIGSIYVNKQLFWQKTKKDV